MVLERFVCVKEQNGQYGFVAKAGGGSGLFFISTERAMEWFHDVSKKGKLGFLLNIEWGFRIFFYVFLPASIKQIVHVIIMPTRIY